MIISADDYFTDMVTGAYKFDPARMSDAHATCFRRFMDMARHATSVVVMSGVPGSGKSTLARERFNDPNALVVDNTNTSAWEISPYVLGAQAHGLPVKVVRVVCDPEAAFKRQTHCVSRTGFDGMAKRFAARDVLPWWSVEDVQNGIGAAAR